MYDDHEDCEKEAAQKTMVAFIAGLLIGGLLVWVFSGPPAEPNDVPEREADTAETACLSHDGIPFYNESGLLVDCRKI